MTHLAAQQGQAAAANVAFVDGLVAHNRGGQ
jgi:prepilin-type processing-associated H-X9-DG protein